MVCRKSTQTFSKKRKAVVRRPTWIAWTEGRNCMRCDCVPTRKLMHDFLCTWFSVNRITFESLNYLRLKWNPNILPPWMNEWLCGVCVVRVCVCCASVWCMCVKWSFKTKVCFCNLFCWRRLRVSKMGPESAMFLSLKLTSMPIVREVFSKITDYYRQLKIFSLDFTSCQ